MKVDSQLSIVQRVAFPGAYCVDECNACGTCKAGPNGEPTQGDSLMHNDHLGCQKLSSQVETLGRPAMQVSASIMYNVYNWPFPYCISN